MQPHVHWIKQGFHRHIKAHPEVPIQEWLSQFSDGHRTTEDKSLAQGHILSVRAQDGGIQTPHLTLHPYQVSPRPWAVSRHATAVSQCLEMGFWKLWRNSCWQHPLSQIRVCGLSNLGPHTVASSSPGYPTVILWLSIADLSHRKHHFCPGSPTTF